MSAVAAFYAAFSGVGRFQRGRYAASPTNRGIQVKALASERRNDAPNPGEQALTQHLFRFLRDESAATAIEYGLIAAGIAVAIITVTKGVGSKLNTTFTSVQTALK
jgi:pilus assembly protein Flp/PilA